MHRRLTVRSRRTRVLALGAMLALDASCAHSEAGVASDDVTSVPGTSVRDQKDTGNCWLYGATGWGEALEYGAKLDADPNAAAPEHWSVAYLDYWDWYTKITTSGVTATTELNVEYQLDSGGSWGLAVEIMAARGIMRARTFSGTTDEADRVQTALEKVAKSLHSGKLHAASARRDRALVRAELDSAFALDASVVTSLGNTFGDGGTTFEDDAAFGSGVLSPYEISVRTPLPDGTVTTRVLRDLIGDRAKSDNPDVRKGEWAWSTATYEKTSASYTRMYLERIQRALAADVPVPISWFVASNGDPEDDGTYRLPTTPAEAEWSGPHATLLTDYEVTDVPGFGTLEAGVSASDVAETAALAESASVTFLRVKNSWGRRANAQGPKGYNDLYLGYLTGSVEVCPGGAKSGAASCWTEVPLEDVALPAGF